MTDTLAIAQVVGLTLSAFGLFAGGLWLTNYLTHRVRAAQYRRFEASPTPEQTRSRTTAPHLRLVHDRSAVTRIDN